MTCLLEHCSSLRPSRCGHHGVSSARTGNDRSWTATDSYKAALIDRPIFLRLTIVAIELGSVLTFINQSGWIAGSEPLQLLPFILVFGLVSQATSYRRSRFQAWHYSLRHGTDSVFAPYSSYLAVALCADQASGQLATRLNYDSRQQLREVARRLPRFGRA